MNYIQSSARSISVQRCNVSTTYNVSTTMQCQANISMLRKNICMFEIETKIQSSARSISVQRALVSPFSNRQQIFLQLQLRWEIILEGQSFVLTIFRNSFILIIVSSGQNLNPSQIFLQESNSILNSVFSQTLMFLFRVVREYNLPDSFSAVLQR